MSDPTFKIRKLIEQESPYIADLINKNSGSENVKAISNYIELLHQYAQFLEAKGEVFTQKHDHHNIGQNVKAELYEYQPLYDNRDVNISESEILIPRETCYYKLSKRLRVNSAQIGVLDTENNQVLIQSVWVSLTNHEMSRLNQLINSDS